MMHAFGEPQQYDVCARARACVCRCYGGTVRSLARATCCHTIRTITAGKDTLWWKQLQGRPVLSISPTIKRSDKPGAAGAVALLIHCNNTHIQRASTACTQDTANRRMHGRAAALRCDRYSVLQRLATNTSRPTAYNTCSKAHCRADDNMGQLPLIRTPAYHQEFKAAPAPHSSQAPITRNDGRRMNFTTALHDAHYDGLCLGVDLAAPRHKDGRARASAGRALATRALVCAQQ